MVDPVSIAGLTIAVFDQLLKLGERTHEFISDARGLDEEFVLLKRKLAEENNRTRQLKLLLFEETSVYGGTTLFEAFDEDSQEQIKLGLLEPLGKLHEGVELLQRRYALENNKPPKSDSQESLAILSSLRRSTKSPMRYINWSFRDKKRATVILNEFSDINHRIHENIKLLCLASSMGVSSQHHLHHLHTDPHSVVLGYSVDANLRITSEVAQAGRDDLELPDTPWRPILSESRLAQGHFGLAVCDKKDIILEFRHYSPASWDTAWDSKDILVDSRTRSLVNGLARMLQQPREHVFMIPRCLGWKSIPEQCQIAFVFDVPAGRDPQPSSLLSLLRNRNLRTSLNDRLNVAFGLARSIAQLQLVRWVHESFRSENIIFFPVTDTKKAGSPSEDRINYAEPWIFGFEFSRPEDFFSSGATDISLERDVYRHPDRQGIPETRFNKLHDIYALGVVLLEIGLWESWDQMQHIENAHRLGRDFLHKALIKQAEKRLAAKIENG
ncbi:hypothetical protein V498_08021 [Pseudogymnoascus sp. VKM F-4517 (FW-2822)]|nr:hypothetical protein V498_08021 [Pseudogymnoascus sp. VKM F-4517 (FW-2822)]